MVRLAGAGIAAQRHNLINLPEGHRIAGHRTNAIFQDAWKTSQKPHPDSERTQTTHRSAPFGSAVKKHQHAHALEGISKNVTRHTRGIHSSASAHPKPFAQPGCKTCESFHEVDLFLLELIKRAANPLQHKQHGTIGLSNSFATRFSR
jgi:hypothetical protein